MGFSMTLRCRDGTGCSIQSVDKGGIVPLHVNRWKTIGEVEQEVEQMENGLTCFFSTEGVRLGHVWTQRLRAVVF